MSFDKEHAKWIEYHLKRRKGERRDRLARGYGHGERLFAQSVWWDLMGSFVGLHPEYEVVDWRGKRFFVDFMFRVGAIMIAFEIKGYGSHVETTDRTRYRLELNRELFLQSLGIVVISIPYDELEANPVLIRSFVRNILMQYIGDRYQWDRGYTRLERDIIRFTAKKSKSVKPVEVARELDINPRTAIKYLKRLSDRGVLRKELSPSGRVVRYEYIRSPLELDNPL